MSHPLRTTPARPGDEAPASRPGPAARPPRRTTPPSVRRADTAARWIISLGGVLVVVTVLGMMAFILNESWPLFRSGRAEQRATVSGRAHAGGVDPYRRSGWTLRPDGVVEVVSLESGERLQTLGVDAVEGRITAVGRGLDGEHLVLGTDAGQVALLGLAWGTSWETGERVVTLGVEPLGPPVTVGDGPVHAVAASSGEDREVVAAVVGAAGRRRVAIRQVTITTDIFGEATRTAAEHALGLGDATALTLTPDGRTLFVGEATGRVSVFALSAEAPEATASFTAADAPVSALGLLIGGRSLVVGTGDGGLQIRALARDGDTRRWAALHVFPPHEAAVTAIAASNRGRSFATGDAEGSVRWHHATSERSGPTLTGSEGPIRFLDVPAKGNGLAAVDAEGRLLVWDVDDPHPEADLGTLFAPVWYEGYAEPKYIWQSSAGSDAFEPKLSLVPLVWGTLKGAFWAMIFATPIALLGAVYSAVFLHPSLRKALKPAIEVMATLPSVVLGFLAALWLAPIVEGSVPAFVLALGLVPAVAVAFAFAWNALPRPLRGRLPPWVEMAFVALSVLVAAGLAAGLGPLLETWWFGGDFQHWLQVEAGVVYEQRNAFVVGIAMGFAVVPMIYTLADDALKAVPDSLKSASLACGASRWQTAMRVVVPTALPGIFSAVMIGLGRAVGETMIVLMATGNTPVMDLLPFTGFRAMSANIAVELPEAPHGGTLYRVLFLTALILFVLTFILNTAAEVIRQRLRKRYRAY